MRRRLAKPAGSRGLGWAVRCVAACSVAGFSGVSCSPARTTAPPNVVMIVVDDLGWTDTAVYGSAFYETPNIDRLAAEGVRFTQFYTASPVCSPTRASLMTGRHPARLDLTNWIGGEQNGLLQQAEYRRELPLDEVTVGELFREAGYATGYVGKWHLGVDLHMPERQGFDVNFAVNHAGQPGSYFPPYANPDWAVTDVPDLEDDPEGAYLTDRLTDASLAFIDDHRDRPFFLVLSHYAVHTPLQAPEEAVERWDARAAALGPDDDRYYEAEHEAVNKLRQDHATYAAMIESTDRSVGRILDRLAESGLDENTVVVFVSDNGGLSTLMRRGFNQATSNVPLRAGKGWLYEGGIRAPLIVRGPGIGAPGSISAAPAMTTDLLPTLLELTGQDLRGDLHLDGRSLAPWLAAAPSGAIGSEAAPSAPGPHEALYWHFPHYHGSGNRPGGAIRIGDLKLVEWFEDGSVELYDLASDLGERRDLAAERPNDALRLLEALRAWRVEVGANMPTR